MHGLALGVENGNTAPGARVVPLKQDGTDSQLWYDDHSTSTIRSKLNTFCLDVEGDLKLMPYRPQQADLNQLWERDLKHGYIRNKGNSNGVLDILNGDKTPGATVSTRIANGALHQLWDFHVVQRQEVEKLSQSSMASQSAVSYYTIVSRMHGLALGVENGNTDPGARVVPLEQDGSDSQLWHDDHRTSTIRSKLNEFCLDVEGVLKLMPYRPQQADLNQLWERDQKHGYIRNKGNNNIVLDILNKDRTPGANVGTGNANGELHQLWDFYVVQRAL
jgi:hypothetical protein